MLLGGVVEAVLLVAVLVPMRRRMLGDDRPRVEGPFSAHPVVGLLEPLAHFLDRLIVVSDEETAGREYGRLAASIAVFVAPLLAFALVPLGVDYAFGSGDVALVVLSPEGGIVWLVVALIVGLYGAASLLPSPDMRVHLGVMTASFAVAAGFAVAALTMVYGSVDPLAIAVQQDSVVEVGDLFGPALPALQNLRLPAWGIFLQPVSFVLFSVCALSIPRLVVSHSRSSLSDPELVTRDGVEAYLVDAARHAAALVLAAWVVLLFFGGGAVPFVTRDDIVGAVAPWYGTGLATISCMAIHAGVFLTKLMLTTWLLEPASRRLSTLSFDRALGFCWRYAIPFALLNVFVTAEWVGLGGRLP